MRDLDGNTVAGPGVSAVTPAADVTETLQRAFIDIDTGVLPPGVYDASLQTAAGDIARYGDAFMVLPEPVIGDLENDTFCASPTARIVIAGDNLYQVRSQAPLVIAVEPGGWRYWASTSGCRPVPFRVSGMELCTRAESPIPADPDLLHGRMTILLPGLPSDAFDLTRDFWIERGAYLDAGLGAGRARAVVDGPLDLPIWNGRIAVGGTFQPSVTIDGVALEVQGTGCSPSDASPVLACTGLTTIVPQGFAPGDHVLRVETGAGCSGTGPLTLGPRPVITSLSPRTVCERRSEVVRICGGGFFQPAVEVSELLTGRSAGAPDCVFTTPYEVPLPAGVYPVVVANDTVPLVRSDPVALNVAPGPPDVYGPRPRMIYSAATRPVFLLMGHVTGQPISAALVPDGGPDVPVDVAAVPGGAEITFPALGASGRYLVRIGDESPCAGVSYSFLYAASTAELLRQDFDTPWQDVIDWYTWSETPGGAPPLQWLEAQGVTGNAVGAERTDEGPDWYLAVPMDPLWKGELDLGVVAFDLRASGSGAASTAPGVRVRYRDYGVEHPLPAPSPGAWTHYEITFADPAGWTYRDADGTRPATHADLLGTSQLPWGFGDILVLGSWWSGPGQAAIDNVLVELAR